MIAWLERAAARRARRSTTSCATGCSAASATGASRSRCCTCEDGTIDARARRRSCRSLLPELDDFKPVADGSSRRSRARADWVADARSRDRRARAARDEHDAAVGGLVLVLPALPRPAQRRARRASREAERYWMPVDLYVGGAEHAVLHLLYARFWHKVLFDLGLVHTPEPFQKLVNQGMILGYSYRYYDDDLERPRAQPAASTRRRRCARRRDAAPRADRRRARRSAGCSAERGALGRTSTPLSRRPPTCRSRRSPRRCRRAAATS